MQKKFLHSLQVIFYHPRRPIYHFNSQDNLGSVSRVAGPAIEDAEIELFGNKAFSFYVIISLSFRHAC